MISLIAFDLDDTISGRIGVRYSLNSGKSDYAFFLFENAEGNWLFSLDDTSLKPKLSVFTENESIDSKTAGELKKLLSRLNEMGIITDNQVKKISGFDIFTHGYKDKKIDEMI